MSIEPIIFRLATASHRAGQLVAHALEGTEFRPEDAALLSVLLHDGPLTPKMLADRLGIGASTLSYRLKHLEARGMVARSPHPDDGRSTLIDLTPAARRSWATVGATLAKALRRAERRIKVPRRELAAALDDLARAIDEELAATAEAQRRR